MRICSATYWRNSNGCCRTCLFVWPADAKVWQRMQATIPMARSSMPMAVDQTLAGQAAHARFFRCCMASHGLRLLHLSREPITQVIPWLPTDRSLFSGFSADSLSSSSSPGGGVDVYLTLSKHSHEGGSVMNMNKSIKAIAFSV